VRLLADENVDAAIVDWLRGERHDVLWAAEALAGQSDTAVLGRAREENRILLTNDLDFGELVFRQRLVPSGVVLFRYRAALESDRLAVFRAHWSAIEAGVLGHYTVLRDRKIRRRRLPS
jgi:predicted nuclease of predicted toxin-antitoxin system